MRDHAAVGKHVSLMSSWSIGSKKTNLNRKISTSTEFSTEPALAEDGQKIARTDRIDDKVEKHAGQECRGNLLHSNVHLADRSRNCCKNIVKRPSHTLLFISRSENSWPRVAMRAVNAYLSGNGNRRDSMISKTVAASTLFAMYIFTMFFIAAIPQDVVRTAGNQVSEISVVK